MREFISDQPIAIADEGSMAEFRDRTAAIAKLIRQSFEQNTKTRVIGVFGPWGSGKTSLVRFAVHELPRHQELEFHPTFYENETAVAASLFKACLKQLEVEAKGLKRLQVKLQLWWHNVRLRHGLVTLTKELLILAARILIFVVVPALAALIVLPGELRTIIATVVALLGGSAIVGERIKKAMEPGLNLDPDDFLSQVKTGSNTGELETYVQEFKWIATLARSNRSPFVVIVDTIDVGLPVQTALILETLRLFNTTDAPCAFVIVAEDIASLRTAVRTRFVNQLSSDDIGGLKESLIGMADAYLDRLLVPFELARPTAAAIQNLLEKITTPSTEEQAG